MLLRLLLVGAVAGLGLDLPTAPEVESWTCLDRAWWDAAGGEPVCERPEPTEVTAATESRVAPIVASETTETALSFETIVDQMAASFASQATLDVAPPPPPETAIVAEAPSFEPFDVDADQNPSLADLLNREFEDAPRANARNPTDAPSRAARWSSALKLTGQAVQAWAVLLKQEPAVAAVH
jgi:hypothetical protein